MFSEPRRRVAVAPGIVGCILVMVILLLIPAAAAAGQATLSWLPNTEPDLAGYKVYFGQASRTYQAPVDVGNSIGYTLTGLQEGVVYFFAVTAYNAGGESPFSSEVSMLVRDTTPPVISAVAVPVRTTSGATITWTTNEASDSQVEYGPTTAYGSVTTLNPSLVTSHLVTLSGLAESRLYHFRIRSRDAAGNLATSGDFTFTTLDATPPTVSITGPAAGATVSGTVTVSATAADNVGVTGVQFRVDGVNIGAEDTVAPYSAAWNTSTSAAGPHTLTAVARDAAGNVTVSAGVSVTVAADTIPPVLSSVTSSSLTSSGAVIGWSSDEPSDSQVEYGATTAYGSLTPLNASLVASHVVTLSGLVDARLYHFRVRSRDAAGNLAMSADFTFTTLDGTPPSVSIAAPAAGATVAGMVTVSASASDNVGVAGVQFQLDGKPLGAEVRTAPYAVAWDTGAMADGSHALTAVARDAAGNSTTSTTISVTVANGSVQVSLVPQDTFINLDATNYSGSALLTTYTWPDNRAANAILMKFDLSSLPAGAVVQEATLALALVESDAQAEATYTVSAHKVIGKNPVIAGATGYTADGVTAWAPSACCFNNVPLGQADISPAYDIRAIDKTAGYKSWMLTTMAREWLAVPASNVGVLLNSDASKLAGRYRYFASTKHPDATIRPVLRVTYLPSSVADTTPPSVALTAPAAEATVSGTVTVSASASDNVGVGRVQFKLDGVDQGAAVTTPPYSIVWNTTTTTNGAHTLTAQAVDLAGNAVTSAPVTVTVANPSPTPVLTTHAPSSATMGGPAFTLTLTGSGFVPASTVRWNGTARTTTFVSATQLTAAIAAADIASQGTASITVFTPAPGGGTSAARTFTINAPAPTLSTLAPTSATSGGAAFSLTVTGSNFVAASEVRWNGVARTTTFLSATQLTAAITAADLAAPGTASVTVVTPTPGGGTSIARTFTVNAPVPTLSALAPSSATAGDPASTLTVTGTNFVAASQVRWNGAARTTTFVSGTQLSAAISAADLATPGIASVTVFSPTPGGGTSGALTFSVNAPTPTLSTLAPSSATAGGPAFTLVVTGTNFVAASQVRWNGAARTTTFVSGTQLSAAIPAADLVAPGVVSVTVFSPTPGGGTSGALTFTVNAPVPTLSTLAPSSATAGGTDFTLTLTGTNFVAGSEVRWNGTARPTTFVSATQLTAAIAAADIAAVGTAPVTVVTPAPGGGTSGAQTFTITASNPLPALSGLAPSTATAGGADFTLTVTGTNFVVASQVQWNGLGRPTTFVSGTQLTASIPAADLATPGTASVTVSTPAPGGGTSSAQTFTIAPNPVPVVSGLAPASATAGGAGFTLTVTGSSFVAASEVRWNGAARTTTFVSATQLTAAIPAADLATPGTASVTVFSPAPGGGTSIARTVTINAPVPTLATVAPASATVGGAAFTLTVTGSRFVAASEVRWNGVARTTTFVSTTQLTAAIPATDLATPGTASVTVFSPTPGGGTSSARTFTVNAAVPTLSTLAPSNAVAGGAAFSLTVTGADFVAASQVRWNGVARTTTFVSATQLTAAISAADIATAGTAQVTVVTPAPGGGISSAQPFTIIAPNPVPVVSGLAPSTVAPGGAAFALTVTGSNFIAASEVRWNGAPRATLFVSSTQLAATIADTDVATAGTAQVTVFTPTPGGGTSGAQTFLITTSNPVPTLSALVPSSVAAGSAAFTLSLAGSNFVATSQVRWNGAPRTTLFVSSTQLTATISDTDIATAGTAQVTVFTPAPGGGTSTAQALTIIVGNPIPALTTLAPSSATAGGIGFTLTVTGSNFMPASTLLWNGTPRPTTFVSATRLTAAIAAADIASPGAADVTVVSPAPGGGASSALTFMRTPPKRLLTAKKQGTGSGKVTSSATVTSIAPALDCGATCTVKIDTGTSMTLQAVASAGSVFIGWSGPCTGSASTCSVVVDSDQIVTAEFKLLSVVSFSAATYSVSEVGPAATITVTRSGGTHAGVSVDVATGDGTARAAADYVAVAQTLTFAAGQTSLTFTVPVSNGTLADGNKTVTLALSNVQGLAVLGPRQTALLTIVDNDVPGTIQFSAAGYTIGERPDAPTTAMIRVTRTGGAASGVTVDFATADGTALAGADYTAVAQTLTFGAGETFKDVPITILPDSLVEGDETIRLTLANPTGGARLGAIPSAALTILDAQIGVQFSAPVYRAGEGAGSATITVVRTGPTTRTTTVVYSTGDGTALAGVDYTATAGVLTFTPGTRSRTFTVPLREDTVVDGVKTVLLLLGATTDGELGPQRTAVLTVADDDGGGTLQFSAPTYSVSEGAALATITVIRTSGLASAVTVDFSTRNGTATAGSDYVVTAGTLSFGPNEVSRTFTVAILNDTLVKGPRTVGLTLSNPTGGAVLGTLATAVLNIVEDDAGGVLRFSAAGYRVSEGGLATITVLRTGGAASAVTVSFTTADGTAVAGIDYTTTAGALTFGAGETTKTFTVPTVAIPGLGRDRSTTLMLSNPGGGAALGVPATAQLTIEDTTASLEFSAATYTVAEARTSVTVTVVRSGPITGTASVRYATADGTAAAGQDYTASSGVVLTFGPGVAARTFTIALRPDSFVEGDETIVLTLGDPIGAVLGAQRTAQVLIVDDDGPGTLQFGTADYRVTEGGTATITVVRTGGSGGTVGVNYRATPGTATSGVDYVATSGVLTFGPGVTSRTFTVHALDNTDVNPDTTVILTLDQPTGGATVGTPSVAVLTITDNDRGGVLQFSAGSYTVTEGGLATISVIRGAGVASDVSVQYATTAGGTAVAGVDFAPVSGTLTFAAGQTSRSFTVPTFGDASAQGDRTVALALTGPTGGAILGPGVTATLVVVDDEPRVRFSAPIYRVDEGGLATLTVLRSGPVTGTVTVDYTASYLTATATDLDGPVSGTLVFGPGVTSRTFTVATHPDTLAEGAEMVSFTLGSPVGASLAAPSTAVLTIVDNDVAGTIQWSAAAYSTTERSGGVLVTITRSGGTASGVTVNYAMSDGTATAGLDYVATSGTVVFDAGETAKTIWIPVLADATLEATETIVLTLSDPTGGAALGAQSSAVVFIVDE